MAIDLAKAQACREALVEVGCDHGPEVNEFLTRKGFTMYDIIQAGGWFPILIGMVPGEYPTYKELAKSIKAGR